MTLLLNTPPENLWAARAFISLQIACPSTGTRDSTPVLASCTPHVCTGILAEIDVELQEQIQDLNAPTRKDSLMLSVTKQARSSGYRRGLFRSARQANGGQDGDGNYGYTQVVYQGNACRWHASRCRCKYDDYASQAGTQRGTEYGSKLHRCCC